jgi:hypothetical protein
MAAGPDLEGSRTIASSTPVRILIPNEAPGHPREQLRGGNGDSARRDRGRDRELQEGSGSHRARPRRPEPVRDSGRPQRAAHVRRSLQLADVLSIVDLASLSTAGTINVGRGPIRGVAITPDGTELYVTNYFSGSVSVLRMPVGGT